MNVVSELFDDAKFILKFRTKKMKSQKELNAQAPKAGEKYDHFVDAELFDLHCDRH